MNHSSIGILRYTENPYKLIVEADDGIAQFYRAMVPKYYKISGRTRYTAHISVVRQITSGENAGWDVPMRMDVWRRYEGREIEFEYESYVYNDEKYYWLNCYSAPGATFTLEQIRTELGLTPHDKITYSLDGRHRFHMTIGNTK